MRIAIRVLSFSAAFFEAGILFLIASSLLLTVMPIAVILYFVIYTAALIGRKRANRKMARELDGSRIFVFFADRTSDLSKNSFFCGLCRDLAMKQNSAVILVSPFYFSSCGIGKKKPYLNIRKDGKNLYMCRRTSFFSLRRNVLSSLDTVYLF